MPRKSFAILPESIVIELLDLLLERCRFDDYGMAYKSLEDIIDVIKESVEIIDVMKPIYNFKASD